MTIDPARRRRGHTLSSRLAALSCCFWLAACDSTPQGRGSEEAGDNPGNPAGESWSITAWGKHFEIFPEVDALVAGEASSAHVHVTRLEDFSPIREGTVEIVLTSPSGEQVFRSEQTARPGIFNVQVQPSSPAELELAFRIHTPEATEEIRGGRVRVGTAERPGGLIVAPAPKGGSGGAPMSFLKEEQWRSDFATSWVRRGELARSVEGLTRLRPPAGGETVLSSPVDGVIHAADAWPFPGRRVQRGTLLFRVAPRIAPEQSLAALEAEASALEIEKASVLERLARLEELLLLEATSRREVEQVRHHAQILEARHQAATQDLNAARTARQGGTAGALSLKAPFAGEIAELFATPGTTVAAGEALARLVRTDRLWLEVALSPTDAAKLETNSVLGMLLSHGRQAPVRLEEGVRLIAVAPEVSPTKGTVTTLLEAPATEGLSLGTVLQGRILLQEARAGIVIPASALIDDSGVSVVYLQLSGESFLRQEVRVLERQGERVLVEGLEPGQRLAHRGGDSIRRSSLMSSGGAHGHVH